MTTETEICPCQTGDGPTCENHDQRGGWRCTLQAGHAGEHIACGPRDEHGLARWPRDYQMLREATARNNQQYPLPRCKHGKALRDHAHERLYPSCGCKLPESK